MLTEAMFLYLAVKCQCIDPTLCPNGRPLVPVSLLRDRAREESNFNPTAINRNKNGTTDYGLMQINSTNFDWLGLNARTALDPCQSIHAAAAYFADVSKYHRGPASITFDAMYITPDDHVSLGGHTSLGGRDNAKPPAPEPVGSLQSQLLGYRKR